MANPNEDLLREVRAWSKKMGYQDTVPDDLIDASNAFIWRQVVDRCHPKHEIEEIRRNLFMQQQKGNNFSAQEHTLWNKKQELLKKLALRKQQLQETTEKRDALLGECKILYVQQKISAAKVSEAQQKTYLYDEKQQLLKKQQEQFKKKQCEIKGMLAGCVGASDVDKKKKNMQRDLEEEMVQINQANCLKRTDYKKQLVKGKEQMLSKLHAVHIEKSLEVKKLQKILHQSQEVLACHKSEQVERLVQVNRREDVQSFMEESMSAIEEQTRTHFLDKAISEQRISMACKIPQQTGKSLKDVLKKGVASVWLKMNTFKELLQLTEQQVEISTDRLKQLQEHTFFWHFMSTYLTEAGDRYTGELRTLPVFNLQYNRRVSATMDERNTCVSLVPLCTVDYDTLRHVQDTMVLPVVQTERIIRYFKDRMAHRARLEAYFKKSDFHLKTFTCKLHDLEELQQSEAWFQPAVDVRRTVRPTFDLDVYFKRIDLHNHEFFGHYVPDGILLKGHKFDYYEDKFMEYFRQIR